MKTIENFDEHEFFQVFKQNNTNFIVYDSCKIPVTVNFYGEGENPAIICGEIRCKLRTYRNKLYIRFDSFSCMAALLKPQKEISLSTWLKTSSDNQMYFDFATYPAFYN